MKNRGILPDSCAWIDYFRPGPAAIGRTLRRTLSEEDVYICGPVIFELIQGVRSEKEQVGISCALGALPYIEMTEALWMKAGQWSAGLRKTGKTIPFSDILIAMLAIENNLSILTVDEHFRDIPGLMIYKTA